MSRCRACTRVCRQREGVVEGVEFGFHFCVCCCVERVWKRMSGNELWRVALDGDDNQVVRLLDEEGVDIDSTDRVSVCLLWLLILVLFGIEWKNCPDGIFLWPLERVTRAAGSRSEPAHQGKGK